jgi:hypothetical protein
MVRNTWLDDDVPAGAVTITLLCPIAASVAMPMRTVKAVSVLPLNMVTETPVPDTSTAVASVKCPPNIVASNVVPAVPREGVKDVIEGGNRD